MHRWITICALALAAFAAGCGGSPTTPDTPGVSITGLLVQIQNRSDGGHDYVVSYTVHNGGPGDATLTAVDAALTAKGSQVAAFNVGFPGGRLVGVSQFAAPTTTTFTTAAAIPVADSLTLIVHYTANSGEQTVSRTAPLG